VADKSFSKGLASFAGAELSLAEPHFNPHFLPADSRLIASCSRIFVSS
jgi:hypothetical protein